MTLAITALLCLTVLALAMLARDAHQRALAARKTVSAADERFDALTARVEAAETLVGQRADHVDALTRQVAGLTSGRKR